MTQRGDVYDLLDQIRERPSMFVEDHSVEQLRFLLQGYEACLWNHDIEEEGSGRTFHTSTFDHWIHETREWSTSCGFAHAIEHEAGEAEAAFALFFELLDEYRAS